MVVELHRRRLGGVTWDVMSIVTTMDPAEFIRRARDKAQSWSFYDTVKDRRVVISEISGKPSSPPARVTRDASPKAAPTPKSKHTGPTFVGQRLTPSFKATAYLDENSAQPDPVKTWDPTEGELEVMKILQAQRLAFIQSVPAPHVPELENWRKPGTRRVNKAPAPCRAFGKR